MEIKNAHYRTVERAIHFIVDKKGTYPTLEQIAKHVYLSPFHFQRMFKEWAGISPKQFLHALTLQHAKQLLADTPATLFNVSHELGLSSTSRLHDLFVKMEAMSPADFKRGAKGLTIEYECYQSSYGDCLIATTAKGICSISFIDTTVDIERNLLKQFPNAQLRRSSNKLQSSAIEIINGGNANGLVLPLHINGTAFQFKVWQALLKIPEGKLTSYGMLAKKINRPKASRAIGTAIGNNPIAYLIPCHRVIQQSGALGGYRWGMTRKAALIAKESVFSSNDIL